MNLPNALTIFRLLLVPVFTYLYAHSSYAWGLIVFVTAALTDMLDGYLARKYHQITNFGKLADPLADKLMTLSMLYCLCKSGYVPWWILYIILAKELVLIIGGTLLVRCRNVVPYSNWAGKITTVTFIVSIICVYPWHSCEWLHETGGVLMMVAVGFALFALFNYVSQYRKYRVKSESGEKVLKMDPGRKRIDV